MTISNVCLLLSPKNIANVANLFILTCSRSLLPAEDEERASHSLESKYGSWRDASCHSCTIFNSTSLLPGQQERKTFWRNSPVNSWREGTNNNRFFFGRILDNKVIGEPLFNGVSLKLGRIESLNPLEWWIDVCFWSLLSGISSLSFYWQILAVKNPLLGFPFLSYSLLFKDLFL